MKTRFFAIIKTSLNRLVLSGAKTRIFPLPQPLSRKRARGAFYSLSHLWERVARIAVCKTAGRGQTMCLYLKAGLIISLVEAWLGMAPAVAQAAHADVEEWVDISPAEIQQALTCDRTQLDNSLDRFKSRKPTVVARGRSVYGLEMRAIYWESERFVIQIAAPEPVARLFIPETTFDFAPVAPAITEIRCRNHAPQNP